MVVKCSLCFLEKTCGECYEKPAKSGNFVCKPCNKAEARIYRLPNKEMLKGFKEMNRESRAGFLQKASGLFKEDLAKELNEAVIQARTMTITDEWEESSEWVDEVELKERYEAERPEQLANILANAQTFEDPVRIVTLSE